MLRRDRGGPGAGLLPATPPEVGVQAIRSANRSTCEAPHVGKLLFRKIFLLFTVEQVILRLGERAFRDFEKLRKFRRIVTAESFRNIARRGACRVPYLLSELVIP